jgi:CHAT domain-containing protein
MNLWKVPDIHTQELTKSSYEQLKEEYKALDALKKARLIMKEKYPNAYYWSALICQAADPNIVINSR